MLAEGGSRQGRAGAGRAAQRLASARSILLNAFASAGETPFISKTTFSPSVGWAREGGRCEREDLPGDAGAAAAVPGRSITLADTREEGERAVRCAPRALAPPEQLPATARGTHPARRFGC